MKEAILRRLSVRIVIAIAATILLVGLAMTVQFRYAGDVEGLYLLKGGPGYLLEIRDDLLLGDQSRLIAKFEFTRLHAWLFHDEDNPPPAHLVYQWNTREGHGFIHSGDSHGNEFVVCLSRFRDEYGRVPKGLFVGGDLPTEMYKKSDINLNETGMAIRIAGSQWKHIWCNVNEGIAGAQSPTKIFIPSEWEFSGSKILFSTWREIALESSHRVVLDSIPLRIDRFLFYRSEDAYIILAIRLKNIGSQSVGYFYVYGDEPWVGDYGFSIGNVGWTNGQLLYYAGEVDVKTHDTVGMMDIGNPFVPGDRTRRKVSGLANFISWFGAVSPRTVRFTNQQDVVVKDTEEMLLDSPLNRMIDVLWGPRELLPDQTETILLAIGKAERDTETGLPKRPEIRQDWDQMNLIMNAN